MFQTFCSVISHKLTMKTISRSNIKEQVSFFAQKHKEIIAVYLFGSIATGRNKLDSDIDIAIMVNIKVSGLTRIAWETRLSELTGKDVDLIIFGQSGALLRHQILKYGKLLYEKDFHDRVEQEVRARTEYLDTRCLYQKLAA
ncbi:nucleotidyltransferase domain-containing protein [Methanosarcinales archaeon]|nr:MAG: nucleotidyltransferase domain-containing protein [Methanosarcinales archaeon]